MNDFVEFSSVLVGYRSVGHANVGIAIRINISVDLLQLKEFMEVGNGSIYFIYNTIQYKKFVYALSNS